MHRISTGARTAFRGIAIGGVAIALVTMPTVSASASAPAVSTAAAPMVQQTAVAAAQLRPTITAAAKASTVRMGSSVTVTGKVSGSKRVPSGRAVVNVNGVPRSNVKVAWNGTFTANITGLGPGTYSLAVRYAGDSTYSARYSAGFRVVVQTLSRTSVSSTTRVVYGDTLAVSAKVSASGVRTPSGRVAFYVSGKGFAAANLSGAVATATVPVLKPGRYRVDGRYQGSSPVLGSVGSRLFDVVRAPSSVDVVLGSTTLEPNTRGTLKLSVSGTAVAPAGSAAILVDGVAKATVPLSAGHASVTLPAIAPGTHSVSVRYGGNNYYVGSTSATVTIKVKAPFVNGCNGAARACVDLTNDLAWIQENGRIIYGPVPMLSGRPGYRTTTGMFSVYWKDIDHESSIFDSAPMPYSIFFNGGEAFHEGSLSIKSHGCIHLGYSASRYFWDALDYGDAVNVFGYAPY
ncbi:MAG: Ig-like domain repeat protein [Nakamurella sp.]